MVIRFDLGNFLATTDEQKPLLTLRDGTKYVREMIMVEFDGIKAER